jgi:hypothetical protein
MWIVRDSDCSLLRVANGQLLYLRGAAIVSPPIEKDHRHSIQKNLEFRGLSQLKPSKTVRSLKIRFAE